ncbi:MAG: M48 family metallopeptidase [Paracoccaceae bacterium]|nr:M48 family metallopeptidase [Paracoccaceae bacterium]
MNEYRLENSPQILVKVRRSAQARRMTLRVSALDGRVTLSLPRFASDHQAQQFLKEHESWLQDKVGSQSPPARPGIGSTILFEGRETPILSGSGAAPLADGSAIFVPGPPEKVPVTLAAYLRVLARQRLATACDRYALQVGKPYSGLSLRDTRSRWGSCSAAGRLMFSWRLIMAPKEVLDYVAAHEVAHLVEMNHSHAYWAVLEGLFPNHKPARAWLKTHGARLHAYRFND